MEHKPYPCPKCNRQLMPEGIVTMDDGQELLSYQCDECLQSVKMFGEPVEVALTFCVGADGKPFDPTEGTSLEA